MNTVRILFFIGCIVLVSCEIEEEIEYKILNHDKKLFVQGYISSDNKIVVVVGQTLHPVKYFTDTTSAAVQNVKVKVLADNLHLFFLQEQKSGYFVSPDTFVAKMHTQYRLEVIAEGFPTAVTAPVYLPIMPQIDSVGTVKINQFNCIKVKLYDYDGNKNYYYLQRYLYHNGNEQDEEYLNGKSITDPIFYPSGVIDDRMFNGKSHELFDYVLLAYNSVKVDSIKVTLYTLSDELVNYLKSLDTYDLTRGDLWQEIPTYVFSNISGGYGVFYSFSQKSVIVNIQNLSN